MIKSVNYVIEADIKDYFDNVWHKCLLKSQMWEICKSGSVRGVEVPRKVGYYDTFGTERQAKQRRQTKPK